MKIIKLSDIPVQEAVKQTVEVLQNGGLVVSPSDTVYGLLVDAKNEDAVKKLIQFKNRPIGKSISVFVADLKMMEEYVEISASQKSVLNTILPGPFTVVLDSKHKTSKIIESEKGTLGVRFITYEFISNLVKAFGHPVTATSANLSGKSPHHSAESLLNQLPESKKELIDLLIDGGQLPRNKPSTVIDLTTPTVKILRHGDIVWKEKKEYLSESASQTQKLAQFIVDKISRAIARSKPVVIILKGDLGAGKTVFVKGVAKTMQIDNIISPTFTIYYEYDVLNNELYKKLYHYDLYNVQEQEEFEHLGISEYLQPGNILLFEWGEKAGTIIDMLKEKAHIVFVSITYTSPTTRTITVEE